MMFTFLKKILTSFRCIESCKNCTKILIYSSPRFVPPPLLFLSPNICLVLPPFLSLSFAFERKLLILCPFLCIYFTEYSILDNIREFTFIPLCYLIWRHYWGFGNCPNVIYIKIISWIKYWIQLSCLLSLFYFGTLTFFVFF